MRRFALTNLAYIFALTATMLGFVSCATTVPKERELGIFPPSPRWSELGTNAVVERIENGDYIVKPNLVEYAIQAKRWIPRVEKWKQENEIP